jgi:hypothetical protein
MVARSLLQRPVDEHPRDYHEHDYGSAHSNNEIRPYAQAMDQLHLETGELVTAERIDVGKPAPGKFVAPVDIWVTLRSKE